MSGSGQTKTKGVRFKTNVSAASYNIENSPTQLTKNSSKALRESNQRKPGTANTKRYYNPNVLPYLFMTGQEAAQAKSEAAINTSYNAPTRGWRLVKSGEDPLKFAQNLRASLEDPTKYAETVYPQVATSTLAPSYPTIQQPVLTSTTQQQSFQYPQQQTYPQQPFYQYPQQQTYPQQPFYQYPQQQTYPQQSFYQYPQQQTFQFSQQPSFYQQQPMFQFPQQPMTYTQYTPTTNSQTTENENINMKQSSENENINMKGGKKHKKRMTLRKKK